MPFSFMFSFLFHFHNHPHGVPLAKFAKSAGLTPVEAESALQRLGKRKPCLIQVVPHPDVSGERLVTLAQRGYIRFGTDPCLALSTREVGLLEKL